MGRFWPTLGVTPGDDHCQIKGCQPLTPSTHPHTLWAHNLCPSHSKLQAGVVRHSYQAHEGCQALIQSTHSAHTLCALHLWNRPKLT
jgi:hypothetical protein